MYPNVIWSKINFIIVIAPQVHPQSKKATPNSNKLFRVAFHIKSQAFRKFPLRLTTEGTVRAVFRKVRHHSIFPNPSP